jgi:hypothetical protein
VVPAGRESGTEEGERQGDGRRSPLGSKVGLAALGLSRSLVRRGGLGVWRHLRPTVPGHPPVAEQVGYWHPRPTLPGRPPGSGNGTGPRGPYRR